MEEEKTRFCPNCGSTWVEPYTRNRAEIAFTGGNPNKWECRECGYIGLMPEGNPEEDVEFEPSENVERVDSSFGRGYFRYFLYFSLPIAILLILLYLLYP